MMIPFHQQDTPAVDLYRLLSFGESVFSDLNEMLKQRKAVGIETDLTLERLADDRTLVSLATKLGPAAGNPWCIAAAVSGTECKFYSGKIERLIPKTEASPAAGGSKVVNNVEVLLLEPCYSWMAKLNQGSIQQPNGALGTKDIVIGHALRFIRQLKNIRLPESGKLPFTTKFSSYGAALPNVAHRTDKTLVIVTLAGKTSADKTALFGFYTTDQPYSISPPPALPSQIA